MGTGARDVAIRPPGPAARTDLARRGPRGRRGLAARDVAGQPVAARAGALPRSCPRRNRAGPGRRLAAVAGARAGRLARVAGRAGGVRVVVLRVRLARAPTV